MLRLLVIWMLFGVLLPFGNAVTKSFVNSSMPEMRPTFVVNFATGTVICQHSSHPDDLHLHQISIICDGKRDCYNNPAMHDESFPYCGHSCNSTCNQRGACLFDGTQEQCYCNAGYYGPQCELNDNNECKDKPCHWLANCRNTYGSYSCTCLPGFQGDGHECFDINECETGMAQCPEHSVCVNLPGTYFCNCTEGFRPLGIPLERCADIDECAEEMHNCRENFKCQNEIGGYKCVEKCDIGYRMINGTCIDINECIEKIAACSNRASCVNTIGSYQCICDDGFTGNGETCTPLNDCKQQKSICDRHAFCIGTLRMCLCQSGYFGDGMNCYDVNECSANHNPCEGQGDELRCVNIDGGYICCEEYLDDKTCIRKKGAYCSGGCGLRAVCYNETCQCMEGFTGDPRIKCSDINECENDKQCPGAGEWCVNMFGGFICCSADSKNPECFRSNSKLSGIRRTFSTGTIQEKETNGFVIINRKVISSEQFGLACYFGCPADSHCVNGTCRCNDGFIGNTFEGCTDVNECQLGLCNQSDSWCVNLRGSFACCNINSTLSSCMSRQSKTGYENNLAGGNTKQDHLVFSSTIKKIADGIRGGTASSDDSFVAGTGIVNESWFDSSGENNGQRSSWAFEKVKEWRNFTGHSIIIGQGRIESKKWNVTRDKGALIGIEVRGNQAEEENSLATSIREEINESDENDSEIEASGEEIGTSDILVTENDGILTSPSSETYRSSTQTSERIFAITTASSMPTISNIRDMDIIRDKVTSEPEIITSQSLKAPPSHTSIEPKILLEKSLESATFSNLTQQPPKALSPKASGTVSTRRWSIINSGQNMSGRFTAFDQSTPTYRKSKLGLKLETSTAPEMSKIETMMIMTESKPTHSKESIGTETTMKTKRIEHETTLTIPSNVEEQSSSVNDHKIYLTDKKIDDSLSMQNHTTVTEAAISFSTPQSKSQWRKEGEQKMQPVNITTTILGADVVINVKQETTTPIAFEVTGKVTVSGIPEFDLTDSTAITYSKSKKPAIHHETFTPSEERSQHSALDLGFEIVKAAPTTDKQIGIEIVKASNEHVSEKVKTTQINVIDSKITKPVQSTEAAMKLGSNLTTVSQRTESKKSKFIQTSVPFETTQTKTTFEKSSRQTTQIYGSNKSYSVFEPISKINKSDTSSKSSLPSFDQLSRTPSSPVSISFSKPTSHNKSSETVATKHSRTIINVIPTDSPTKILKDKELSTTETIRLITLSTNQAATSDQLVKLTDGNATEEVIVIKDGIRPVSDQGKSVTTETKNDKVPAAKDVEVNELGEKVIEVQTASSATDFLSAVTIDNKSHEVGLEIVLTNKCSEATEPVTYETSSSPQTNWTNTDILPNVTLDAELTTAVSNLVTTSRATKKIPEGQKRREKLKDGDTPKTVSETYSPASPIAEIEKTTSSTVPKIIEPENIPISRPKSADEKTVPKEQRGKKKLKDGDTSKSISETDSTEIETTISSGILEKTEPKNFLISRPKSVEENKTILEEQRGRKKVKDGDTSKSISETDNNASLVAELEKTTSSTIPEITERRYPIISEPKSEEETEYEIDRVTSTPEVFSQSKKTQAFTTSTLSSHSMITVGQETSISEHDKTTSTLKSEETESKFPEINATLPVTKDEKLESVEDKSFLATKLKMKSRTKSLNITTTVSSVKRKPVPVQEEASSFSKDIQITASLAFKTSTSISIPSTKSFANYRITANVISPESITSASQVSETYSEDSATEKTSSEYTIGPQQSESPKNDLLLTRAPSKSDLETVSTTDSTDLLKAESEAATWTIKPENSRKNDSILGIKTIPDLISEMGATQSAIYPSEISTEIKQVLNKSLASNEGLLKTTQQKVISPMHANVSKPEMQTLKETYLLQEATKTSVTQSNTSFISLRCRSSNECGADAYCERRSGVCRCYPGFDGQPPMMPCVDIDECDQHLADCDSSSRCFNIVGGFMCFCETGYRMSKEHVCVDIDECQERTGWPCSQYATCINIPGSYQCQCDSGYKGDGYTCIPMNKRHCKEGELAKSNCGRNNLCLVSDKGKIDCDTCKKGFMKEGTKCIDIDECNQSNLCHENAFCENINGSYLCHCKSGYKGDGYKCEDIDECENNPCHAQGICINQPGSFSCKCPDGWTGDGTNECVNPSDSACLDKLSICNHERYTSCLSVNLGNVTMSICECAANYRYNHIKHVCEDIDECKENRHSCDPSNSICVNTIGGYTCLCAPGYEGVGGVCVDINECERGIAGCNVSALCINYVGSVGCKCPSGFIGNGIHCIATKLFAKADSDCNDEWRKTCQHMNRTCHIDDEDVQQCGSCIIGFQPVNGKCLPVQEAGNCVNPQKNDCDANAECIDVHPGRHFCICKMGYIGDGRHCDGPNCHLNPSMCHKNARCQLDGSCKCKSGYHGDGIDVCQSESVEKQTEKMLENRTRILAITKTSAATEMIEEKSVTLTDDSIPASGFDISFASLPVTESTDATNDTRHQQSSILREMTSEGTSVTESSMEGSITAVTTSEVSSDLINETATVFEGSDEGDNNSRIWQHRTKPGDKSLVTTGESPFEMASKLVSVEETTLFHGSSVWDRSSPTSSTQDVIISDEIQKAVIPNCTAFDQSVCHEFAICNEESGECICKIGYHGDGYSICMKDSENCTSDPMVCDLRASCDESMHTCKCIPGYVGDGIICAPDTFDCLLRPNLCSSFAKCIGRRCICNAGYTGDGTECVPIEPFHDCTRCDSNAKCCNETCICNRGYFGNGAVCIADPADCFHYPGLCNSNAICDQKQRRCKCTRGFIGDGMECKTEKELMCTKDRSICDRNAECLPSGICQCKQGFKGNGYYCRKVNLALEEVIQLAKSNISQCKEQCVANEECYRGECRCVEGYKRSSNATCIDIDECSMGTHTCHPTASCTNVPGSFICICPTGYHGNGRKCFQHHRLHNMSVDCELEGMTLLLPNNPDLYNGRIFVRGQTDNPFCSKKLNALPSNETEYHFMINYSHCNVRFEEPNIIAVTVVIQRHPLFITERADAYDVRCTYPIGARKVASHVGISEITTSKTIVETGVGPTCSLTVTDEQDQLIDTATVGQPLKLVLSVYPNDTYAVLPRNCFAINLETGELYLLTDQSGCAIDTELFPEWTHRQEWLTTARFRTFKWPDSSMIRFQCDCSACIGSCPKINCTKRHESMKQQRFRHIREIPRNFADEQLEKQVVKNGKSMAYSRALYVNEEEELIRAQRDMKSWKYPGLQTYEEPIDDLGGDICIRVLWIMLSLLPLLVLLVLIGVLLVIWRRKSFTKMSWRRPGVIDSQSSFLKF